MIAYVDSSVILRIVFDQPQPLSEWRRIARSVSSALVEVECFRTLDRLGLTGELPHSELATRRATLREVLVRPKIVEITPSILRRASEPLPIALATLDAIHLATALLWREEAGVDLVMATHDQMLARAAAAYGFKVIGSRL